MPKPFFYFFDVLFLQQEDYIHFHYYENSMHATNKFI